MSELALTALRLGFLLLLWFFVYLTVSALRRDIQAPSTAGIPVTTQRRAARRSTRQDRPRARTLVVTHGSLEGTVLPLGTSAVTIGRSADNTLVIEDDYASGHHARLYQSEGRWIVEDLGSTNGTWIDRARITGPTVLELGSPLRIGRSVFELRK